MKAIADLFFPDCCLGCGLIARGGLCMSCLKSQGRVERQATSEEFEFDESIQTYVFTGLVRRAIHRLKYKGERSLAEVLAIPLVAELRALSDCEIVTWIPASHRKVTERGFDHAQLLAEIAAEVTDVPCLSLLERTRESVPQFELDLEERKANVDGLFSCRLPAPDRVAVIDDVFTTGATASDAARALKGKGAEWVVALAVARTP